MVPVRPLERGALRVVVVPRVGRDALRGVDDVARLLLVLAPDTGRARRIVIGQKRLPRPGERKRAWALVDRTAWGVDQLIDEGVVGAGRYLLTRHGDHTHLVYALGERPHTLRVLQPALELPDAGSFVVAVRNPRRWPPGAPLPRALQERFHGRVFVAVDPPAFLDHARVQLFFMGARPGLAPELGARGPAPASG